MKKILVTGGTGFLGSHLCIKLHKQGHHIICLDNNFTGNPKNVDSLISQDRFELIERDIRDSLNIQVDEIYNLACPASPVHYQHDPLFTIETSYLGAKNMLELAKDNKAKILQASTSEVYGDPQVHPQAESYWGHVNPIGPRACYDEGKRIAETLFINYNKQYQTDIRIMRIFNTYGPHMHPQDGRVVSNFIIQALTGKDITIYGDGTQTRSFCYMDDLLEGCVRLMNTNSTFNGPVNIGNPTEFTIKELAEKVLELTEATSQIVYQDLPQDDPLQRKPDISKAQDMLDWQPKVQLEEGLKHTIKYFKKII